MNKILRVFLGTDMRSQHDGLTKIAKEKGVDLSRLKESEHVIFINERCNRVKLFSRENTFTYMKRNQGRIDLNMIEMIPLSFEGKVLDWNKAERLSLEKKLGKNENNKQK